MYKPILKVLEERRQKIAQSLEQADEITKRLTAIELENKNQARKTARESQKIIESATESAEKIIKEAKIQAGNEADKVLERAQKTIESEREKLYREIKLQIAVMVADGLEKVVGRSLNAQDHKRLIEESIRDLK